MQAGQRGEQNDNTAQDDHHANDLIDDANAVGVELGANLVHQPCEAPPPHQCACHNTDKAHHHFDGTLGQQTKGKLRIERHKEENNQRITQSHQKGRDAIVGQRALVLAGLSHVLRRVGAIGVEPEDEQHHTARYLQIETVGVVAHKIDHQTHAQPGDAGIDDVAQRGAAPRDEPIPPALVQRALHTEHTHRTHRRRGDDTYEHSFKHDIQDVGDGIEHNGCKGTLF